MKARYKPYKRDAVISTSRDSSFIPVDKVDYVSDIFVNTEDMTTYFEIYSTSGQKKVFKLDLPAMYKKETRKSFWFTTEHDIHWTAQDYFDSEISEMLKVRKNHKLMMVFLRRRGTKK